MKILIIVTTPFFIEKGSSMRVLEMVKALSGAGHKIDVVTYPVGKDPKIKGVKIHRVKSSYSSTKAGPSLGKIPVDMKLLKLAKELVSKKDYDVIQGEDTEGAFISSMIDFEGPRVYDCHNRMTEQMKLHKTYPLMPAAWVIEKIVFGKSDLVITNWAWTQKYIKQAYPKKKTVLVYDSVNTEIKKPKLDLPENYIVYTGNFEGYQGTDLLIQAYQSSGLDIPLILVGPHSKQTIKRGRSKTIFVGRQSVENTNYIIKNAMFAIIPRVHGRQPSMKIIHYLVHGKAILATDVPCNQELLKGNALFANANVKEFRVALRKLSKNQKLVRDLESKAAKISPNLTTKKQEEKLLKAYSKLKY